jgi:hypothetical protein
MASREELEILLRDSITPGLRSISRELRELNKVAKETDFTDQTRKLTQSFTGVDAATNAALRSMTAMGAYVIGFGKAVVGIGGTVESIKRLGEGIQEFAEKRVELALFSADTRLAASDIDKFHKSMNLAGISTGVATQYIAKFSTQFKEVQALGQASPLIQGLARMERSGPVRRQLLADAARDDAASFWKHYREALANAPRDAKSFLEQLTGIPETAFKAIDDYGDKVVEFYEGNKEAQHAFHENLTLLMQQIDNEQAIVYNHIIEGLNPFLDKMRQTLTGKTYLSDFFISEFEKIARSAKDTADEVNYLIELFERIHEARTTPEGGFELGPTHKEKEERAAFAKQSEDLLKGTTGPAVPLAGAKGTTFNKLYSDKLEEAQLQRLNNELLKDIRDMLSRSGAGAPGETGGAPGGTAGGAPGGTAGGVGGYAGSAAGPYSGGGREGGGGAPGKFKFGNEDYTGPGAQSPMRLGGTLPTEAEIMDKSRPAGERFNNPFNMWYDSYAGAAGGVPGRQIGPFDKPAIFPSKMSGAAAAIRKMAESDLYRGKTMQDLIQTWVGHGQSYAPIIEQMTGISRNTRITPEFLASEEGLKFLKAMSRYETRVQVPYPLTDPQWREARDVALRRKRVDQSLSDKPEAPKGEAKVSVDFSDVAGADRQLAGGPFKNIKVGREPQAPKAGSPGEDHSTWYYQ